MTYVLEFLLSALLVGGGLFGLIGSWGLIRLKDPMQRLHAPTKASTLGVGSTLVAAGVSVWLATGEPGLREALIAVFIFVTAPLSALMLAKAHLHRTVKRKSVPRTGTGSVWATFGKS